MHPPDNGAEASDTADASSDTDTPPRRTEATKTAPPLPAPNSSSVGLPGDGIAGKTETEERVTATRAKRSAGEPGAGGAKGAPPPSSA